MAKLKVTMVRGLEGRTPKQRLTVKGLGLKRRHQSVILEDTAAIRGMINKVQHLVEVVEVEE